MSFTAPPVSRFSEFDPVVFASSQTVPSIAFASNICCVCEM
jgi:hypothetical protein